MIENLLGESIDEAGLLSDANKAVGHDQFVAGMLPTDQRLKACQGAGLAFDLWLIGKDKLVVIESALEILRGNF